MKIRSGFVSNSSSTSFIVARHRLTDDQFNKLEDMYENSEVCDNQGKLFNYNSDVVVFTGYEGIDKILEYLRNIGVSPKEKTLLCIHG